MQKKETASPNSGDLFGAGKLILNEANGLYRAGRLPEAAHLYQHLLKYYPPKLNVLNSLGGACLRMSNYGASEELFKKSLSIEPNQPQALMELGVTLYNTKRFDEAIACYDRVIAIKPDFADAHSNRGIALKDMNLDAEALASYDRAISIRPDYPESLSNRGIVLHDLKRFDEAIASYDRAIAANPKFPEAHFNRGNTLREVLRYDEAIASYERATSLRPTFAEAYFNRGNTLRDMLRFDEALASYGQAASAKPRYAEAHCNKGILLQQIKRYDEARASFDAAIASDPDYTDGQFNRAEFFLLMGDYQQGWDLYEWRFKTKYLESHPAAINLPLWTGAQSVAGKRILIHSKAGYGDYLMFIRYVPLLKKLGATVIVFAPKPLLALFSASDTDVQVVDMDEPVPEVDFQCPIMSLPKVFRTTLDTIPADLPYLKAPPEKLAYWRQKLPASKKLRIGLMWSGSPNRNIDKNPLRNRTAPLNAIRPLLDLPFEFHSLQKEPLEDEAALLSSLTQIHNHQEELGDFSDTAALIDRMDLVISIDTSVAHLAGGLGKPLWVILPYASDYRWMPEGDKTPWYPNVTQFRQNAVGDWNNVIERVKDRLQKAPLELEYSSRIGN